MDTDWPLRFEGEKDTTGDTERAARLSARASGGPSW